MQDLTEIAVDSRQTTQWAEYLSQLGWTVVEIDGVFVYSRRMPIFNNSIIKISRPRGPIPFEKIEKFAKEQNALFVLLEPDTHNNNPEQLKKAGYTPSALKTAFTATRLIDISPEQQTIFDSFSENARRNIKKAQKNNLEIKHDLYGSLSEAEQQQTLQRFYDLYRTLAQTKNFYILPFEEIKAKATAFKNNCFFSFVYLDNQPIATVWFAYHNNTLVYFHTGITQTGYDKLANYLLVWEGILQGKKLGMQVFDFESVFDPRFPNENKKWKGYSEFKGRFHGQLITYPPSWIKIYNYPYKLLHLCASLISKLQ